MKISCVGSKPIVGSRRLTDVLGGSITDYTNSAFYRITLPDHNTDITIPLTFTTLTDGKKVFSKSLAHMLLDYFTTNQNSYFNVISAELGNRRLAFVNLLDEPLRIIGKFHGVTFSDLTDINIFTATEEVIGYVNPTAFFDNEDLSDKACMSEHVEINTNPMVDPPSEILGVSNTL